MVENEEKRNKFAQEIYFWLVGRQDIRLGVDGHIEPLGYLWTQGAQCGKSPPQGKKFPISLPTTQIASSRQHSVANHHLKA